MTFFNDIGGRNASVACLSMIFLVTSEETTQPLPICVLMTLVDDIGRCEASVTCLLLTFFDDIRGCYSPAPGFLTSYVNDTDDDISQ